MALKQQLTPKLSQRLVITPALQQSIKMLQMNRLEIETLVQTELQDNVVLEIGTEESVAQESTGTSTEDSFQEVPSEDNQEQKGNTNTAKTKITHLSKTAWLNPHAYQITSSGSLN
jgi:RNA polymerase sigma-54 factor